MKERERYHIDILKSHRDLLKYFDTFMYIKRICCQEKKEVDLEKVYTQLNVKLHMIMLGIPSLLLNLEKKYYTYAENVQT